mmetsp:Transcript_13764/g.25220  ORF Transcript_13764/g.25220 Transcript_13764/m.25220 type:complete len:611 (+) Transcript_13764:125-1957(+)
MSAASRQLLLWGTPTIAGRLSLLMACFRVMSALETYDTSMHAACEPALGVSMLQTARANFQAADALAPLEQPEEKLNLLGTHRQQAVTSTGDHASLNVQASLTQRTTCLVSNDGCEEYHLESAAPYKQQFERVQIVVTRHKEDITWLDFLPDFATVVYNKGGRDSLLPAARPNLQIVNVENTGREDDTMLRHIIDNYDNASEITIFLQGWPYNHCGELGDTVRRAVEQAQASGRPADFMYPLSHTFWEYGPKVGLNGLASQLVAVHAVDEETMRENNIKEGEEKLLFDAMCARVLQEPCPASLWVAEGAQWIVGRNMLRATNKSVYAQALRMGEGFQDEYRGLVMEALWPVLWGHSGWSPRETTINTTVNSHDVEHVLAHERASQSSNHCQSRLHEILVERRLASCETNMGFCELKWYADSREPSAFYTNTLRRAILVTAEPSSKEWSLAADLQAAMPGRSSMVQVVGGEPVVTTADSDASSWMLIPSDKDHTLSLRQLAGEKAQHLGCMEGRSDQQVLPVIVNSSTPVDWKISFGARGRVSFQAPTGHFLCVVPRSSLDVEQAHAANNRSRMALVCSNTSMCMPGKGRPHLANQFYVKPLEAGSGRSVV